MLKRKPCVVRARNQPKKSETKSAITKPDGMTPNFGLLVGIGQDGRACDLLLVPHALRIASVRMHLHGQWSTRGEDLREDGGLFSGEVIGESFGRVSGVVFVNRCIHR